MSFVDTMLDRLGRWMAGVIEDESSGYEPFTPSDPITLRRTLRPCDILLIEGNQKVSTAIKYLTQSTWSHAAIYVGDALGPADDGGEPKTLIEANIGQGVVAVKLSKFATYNTRICRPVGLTVADRKLVVQFMVDRLGLKYDTRNILDLARYLFRPRLRRADTGDLLDPDRSSLQSRALSDPAAHREAARPRMGQQPL